ncbi:deoxyribodipyrimidine photo-lyase [Gordonia effusa NBRC 100432]|uniref:Deoxyribodipyrimidine photo-lyase n=1 Tax=Gordonia effusa NBRC 100432 TaxID=1077974 RepID=H0R6X3_9ACTN|nr:deoxyribodipyrimidine photo-lyase [Gordonia effusa]GAB20824.1 deoxyribodipyrimidine photo-lyase [Gordonia effusa NBRC 100432]
MTRPAIMWFRRDLRLADLPPLLAAVDRTAEAIAVFVLDDALLRTAGGPRMAFLAGCVNALNDDLNGRLLILRGPPEEAIPALVRQVDADSVHISADFGPYGTGRDSAVRDALSATGSGVPLIATGSPYAVSPGRIVNKTGNPYQVFTPFRRAWLDHGWHTPAHTDANTVRWLDPTDVTGRVAIDSAFGDPGSDGPQLLAAGERAAQKRWRAYLHDDLDSYSDERDRPDLDTTTRLSAYLKFGCLHPRTILHDIRSRSDENARTLRSELAWRDFYADVLYRRPDTARHNYNKKFDNLRHDSGPHADAAFEAWCSGRTGYPIVDAGMRQLLAEGWMHNRVRMIVASFLTKDLHLPWWWGARHFMTYLVDGDLASNQHGWQWTAGCGTDAAPYFRVFNPTGQGERFDPNGDYVRRWVPELRGIKGKAVHQPWKHSESFDSADYPAPIVDHAAQRLEALARYDEL